MNKKPDESSPRDPGVEPAPSAARDAMNEALQVKLQLTRDAAAKSDLAKSLGVADSGIAARAKSLNEADSHITDTMAALKAAGEVPGSTLAAALGALKLADTALGALKVSDLLAQNERRWSGLIGQATETAKMAHGLADFRRPELQLNERLWDDTQLARIEPRPDPLPGMSAELSRVSELVAVMADNVAVMATIGQRAEEALIRLEVEAGHTRVETERLRGALEKGQRSSDRLAGVLIFLTVVIAGLTLALVLRGG